MSHIAVPVSLLRSPGSGYAMTSNIPLLQQDLSAYLILIAKRIAALRAELRRIVRILGLPAALVTLVKRSSCRLGASALCAELALVYSAA